jgi:hypothetical protein
MKRADKHKMCQKSTNNNVGVPPQQERLLTRQHFAARFAANP